MEINKIKSKILDLTKKYKYAIIVLLIGLALLLIPSNQSSAQQTKVQTPTVCQQETFTEDSLAKILQSIAGAGNVKVLLSKATGEETLYQTDIETSMNGDSSEQTVKTVVFSDAQRNEAGLIRQVNPASYKGAIVVCQGADSPAVKLAVTEAVSKITGLGTDAICVLKMQ